MEEDGKKDIVQEAKKETPTVDNQKTEQEIIPEPKKEEKVEKTEKEENKSKEAKKEKNANKESKPKKKHLGLIIAIILILVIAGVAAGAYFMLKTTTIDLAECIIVEYEGKYSGYATVKSVEIDQKKLKEQIEESAVVKKFIKDAKLSVEETENLSNGDEITVKVKISNSFLEDNKLKLKEANVKIKVDGLEEPKTIDMSKYIEMKYKGFNNHATAEATLKTEEIEKDFGYDIYSTLRSRITLSVEDNGKLANNGKVKVNIEVDDLDYLEENGIKISSDTVEFDVNGLKDATEVDAFKDIKINVTGMSPNLSVTITNNSTDEFLRTVQYTLSKKSGISNGETITITAERWNENLAEEKGVALKETTMKYTVSGQAAYIFNVSEINDSVKNNLKSIIISKATSKANENYSVFSDNVKYYLASDSDYRFVDVGSGADQDLTVGAPEIVSMYLLTKKEDKNTNDINIITAIVRVPYTSAKSGATYNWYITVQATNASLKADGTISDNTNYSITATDGNDEEKAYQTYVNSKKNDYNVDQISL